MDAKRITPEIMEKAKACSTPEELFNLAKTEGMELTDDQLDTIAAGGDYEDDFDTRTCTNDSCNGLVCSYYMCTNVSCTGLDCDLY